MERDVYGKYAFPNDKKIIDFILEERILLENKKPEMILYRRYCNG